MAGMSLPDDQWERIRPLLPGKQTDCGVTAKDNRTFLEAVLWIARTGAPCCFEGMHTDLHFIMTTSCH